MAAVRHLGLWKKHIWQFHTLRDPSIYVHIKFGEYILIDGRDMPPKTEFEKTPLTAEFYFRFKV